MTRIIAVIDKTGRGHAICDALTRTDPENQVYYIPGTGGVFGTRIHPVPGIALDDGPSIAAFCRGARVELAVVSHIDALRAGVAELLREAGLRVMGPSRDAVRLESSKWFCREVCRAAGIPVPASRRFDDEDALMTFLAHRGTRRYYVKADGLTQHGNGAFPVGPDDDLEAVRARITTLQAQNDFGAFSYLVEDEQPGEDFSAHFLLNEHSAVALPSAMDFKRAHDRDRGANCDGMGSVAPHPSDCPETMARIRRRILAPLLAELQRRKMTYNGPIYLGLRIDEAGAPHLIEINARMGDSESEVIFPLIDQSLSALFGAIADGTPVTGPVRLRMGMALTVSLVTGAPAGEEGPGWPDCAAPTCDRVAYRPDRLDPAAQVFWANVHGRTPSAMTTTVGRVAHVTGRGPGLQAAYDAAYASLDAVDFPSKRFRSDIGIAKGPQRTEIPAAPPTTWPPKIQQDAAVT